MGYHVVWGHNLFGVSVLSGRQQQAKIRLCLLAASAMSAPGRGAITGAAGAVLCSALRSWADYQSPDDQPDTVFSSTLQQAALKAIAAFIPSNIKQVRIPADQKAINCCPMLHSA